MTAKITLIHDNGAGDVSSVSLESEAVLTRDGVISWFDVTGLLGIGFNPKDEE